MTPTLAANLVAYSAQIACVVAAGSLLPILLRIDAPSVRYAYWRALLALCLVLPLLQEWRAVTPGVATVTAVVSEVLRAGGRAAPTTASQAAADWLGVAAFVLAGGVLVRFAWVAMSLLRLRRMRSAGRPAPPCAEHADLQRGLGTHADIRYVANLHQPVTFGVRWPVVLLPEATLEQPAEIQHAVLCHELIHVERHDWAWVLVEELVRALLWFHPAVWWMVSRVQAAREEVVDALAVRITGGRRRYIEALMVFADAAQVAPAAAFSRRRHLFRRILLLSREPAVSTKRLVVSCAVMALVLLTGSWYAIDAFPLSQFPSPATEAAAPLGPEPQTPAVTSEVSFEAGGVIGGPAPPPPPPPPPPPAPPRRASRSPELPTMRTSPGTRSGDTPRTVAEATLLSPSVPQTAEIGRPEESQVGLGTPPPTVVPATEAVPELERSPVLNPVRIGGRIGAPRRIKDVRPVYPPIAASSRVSGIVIIETTIGVDGRVEDARVIRSIPFLDDAALEAVRQWEFTPTLLNGAPTPVIMSVTVNFSLQN